MSSNSGGPPRGRSSGRSSSASAVAARSSGSTPPASRAVFSPPEKSQASLSLLSVSVLGPDLCGRYRSTMPSQSCSRSFSVIREESGLPSTARPISRSSSPTSSTGAPSHGDQEMGDVLETLAQPLVLNMLEGHSNVSENLGVILLALDMICTWIYTYTEHPETTSTSINLSGIRRNATSLHREKTQQFNFHNNNWPVPLAPRLQACIFRPHDIKRQQANPILFVEVLSKAEWGIHFEAHQFVQDLPIIRVGPSTTTSLDYQRSQFLEMKGLQGKSLQPLYIKGGT
ncbi:hypothetical protein L218DRAFT_946818 [Marasmius fiardii PR-910]|nr:hypothetical protein L218DRAFT_946818 [Marasmius fiardii PR-910]